MAIRIMCELAYAHAGLTFVIYCSPLHITTYSERGITKLLISPRDIRHIETVTFVKLCP